VSASADAPRDRSFRVPLDPLGIENLRAAPERFERLRYVRVRARVVMSVDA
jgi:hypothetical protein